MWSLKYWSINSKLRLLVLLASGSALVLSCLAFAANDLWLIRSSMVEQLSSLSDVLGSNSTAAIVFDDTVTASELLSSLRLQPTVVSACLYDERGKLFATYSRQGAEVQFPLAPPLAGYQFCDDGYLRLTRTINSQNEKIGTIHLQATMEQIHEQYRMYAGVVGGVLAVALAASLLLSSRLQRTISLPILQLAQTAQRISADQDYSLRVAKTSHDELGTLYDEFNAMLDQIQQAKVALQQAHDDLERRVEQRTRQLSELNFDLNREIAERTRAEKELEAIHQRLMESARRAGMAEIATGVLHNVGNVLNSINVSATLASDRVRQSKVDQLERLAGLIESNAENLRDFVADNPKGQQLPGFLRLLANHLSDERDDVLRELEALTSKVDHIKTIVATQQSYAGVSGVIETVDIAAVLDDAFRLNSASLDRHKIQVVRDYSDLPRMRIDKPKVLQILVNLVKNAKDALLETPSGSRQIRITTRLNAEGQLEIAVSDNGTGIPQESLTRIFSHGYTTKKQGHGFGLHSCANAAREMGGSLRANSEGLGHGARFVLVLPFQPVDVTA